jgi:A-macroglobulin TED domain/Alpha-2-macroglobulin family/MG2 domain/A-macroglobulin receptor binding domain/Macroglobulin domain MG3/Alpha-2-macroglobulin bait region domain
MSNKERDIFKLVDGYLYELLSPADAEYVEQQCEVSPVWQAALEQAQRRQELMQSVPASEASDELIQNTLSKIKDHERRVGHRRRLALRSFAYAAAACVAVVGTLHLYYLNLSASPYDLRVFGQTELLADSDASIRVQVFDRDGARGVSDVPVEIELRDKELGKTVRLASFRTEVGGTHRPRFRLPDWKDGDYELRVVAKVGGQREEVTRAIKLKRSWRLMLSTDKPVYQPGQTILCRSLALRKPDLKPVAGNDLVFTITDPKGNVIFKQEDVTSRFGIASIECPLATEIIEGPYTIEAAVGDTTSRLAVEVKKYVLPKFKIAVDLDLPYYEPGQSVHGTVQADYFFGKPVANAQVRIQAIAPDVAETTLTDLSVETDEMGRAAFTFNLPSRLIGREQASGDAPISVHIDVTDSAGQKVTKRVTRVVTANPIRVEVIAESGTLVRGVTNTVYLFASYADGRPARVRLAVSGFEHELQTGATGVAMFEITPKSDEVSLTVRATDDDGRIGRRRITLKRGANTADFLVRTDKAVYDGGETIRITALGGGRQPVFIDFIKDGQTILTEAVELNDGQGEYQFDLPPDVFGTLDLVAYRFGEAGLPVRKSRVLYVRQASTLTIESKLDLDEYRPGGSAKLILAVTDSEGRPAPGAVSLAAVDEAVFGVLDQAPGLEGRFFTLEQELLQPIYAIYPWSPDLTTSLPANERISLEQALFTRASNARTRGTSRSRDATLQALLDAGSITPNMLEVLNDPNLDDLLQRTPVSDSLKSIFENNSQHTLWATSFPVKTREVSKTRTSGLRMMNRAWVGLGVVIAISAIVAVCLIIRNWLVYVAVGLLALLLIVPIFLPSLSRARELSKRLVAASNLKGLDTSLRIMEAEGGLVEEAEIETADSQPVRVREWFPETLLWRPELITDDEGRVSIDINLADSITTWRVSASAVSAEGSLGGSSSSIRVFQPFFVDLNLPVALTRGDEITIPAVVYNYLDTAQTVELSLEDAQWFERLDETVKRIELEAGEVKSVGYRIRVRKVGKHELQVTARGGGVSDAIKRAIEVVPDGRRIEQVFNGTLARPAELSFAIPDTAIEGSAKTIVKVYPSSFSQLVEGLDSIFQRPYGCFEQTSSTTYPNVLALDYLRRTGKSVPEVEAKARQYIHLGYQRLLTFEVDGGGFDWFGRAPANRTLTAYGLMEFEDMAKVHDVDPNLIDRTRQWLMEQQSADGSWPAESHKMHVDPTQSGQHATLSTTAYIAWAVFQNASSKADAAATRDYLVSHSPQSINDPYLLAVVSNALLAIDPSGATARPYVARLDGMKNLSSDAKLVWWEQGRGTRTTFYGSGRSGSIETTSTASLAMMDAGFAPGSARGALTWLAEQKDSLGTFHSTQATVLALKALLAGTGRPLGGDVDRQIEIALGGEALQAINIPADQGEVVRQVDLSELVGVGSHRLTLTDLSDSGAGYQVAVSFYVPTDKESVNDEPLSIEIDYDRTDLIVGDSATATATIVNNMSNTAPMVILDLPIPAGFRIDPIALDQLVQAGTIAKYQINPRSAVVYLRSLESGSPLVLEYRLTATMPVKLTVPPARVYEYYNPDAMGSGKPASFRVTQRT